MINVPHLEGRPSEISHFIVSLFALLQLGILYLFPI